MTYYARCVCGHIAEADDGTCGHYLCAWHNLGWGPLELRKDAGGWRHYLRGEPVSCGSGLWLKAVVTPERSCQVDGEPVQVRYESPLFQAGEPPALLYCEVGGHMAVITAHPGLRLRWPHRAR
jgi:hypothetical protein